MVVEITGCTSAGKTTVLSCLINKFRGAGINAVTGYDFILTRFWLGSLIDCPRLKSLAVEFVLLPWIVRCAVFNSRYISISIRHVLTSDTSWWMKLNIARNLVKVLAIVSFVNPRCDKSTMCLLDEGPVHSLNNVFVDFRSVLNTDSILKSIKLLPCVDRLIIVSASPELIVKRALSRPDAPFKNRPAEHWMVLAENAERLFKMIRSDSRICGRVLEVRNNDSSFDMLSDVDRVVTVLSAAECPK